MSSKSKRCEQCKKKLGVMEYVCKCEKLFCITHLKPEEHHCGFDHLTAAKALLQTQLTVGPLSVKVEPI